MFIKGSPIVELAIKRERRREKERKEKRSFNRHNKVDPDMVDCQQTVHQAMKAIWNL